MRRQQGVGSLPRGIAAVALTVLVCLLSMPLSAQRLPFRTFTPDDDGLANSQTWVTYQDSRGVLWFGTSTGLSRYDGLSFSNFATEHGLHNLTNRDILEDASGALWVATDDGASRYDGENFEAFGPEQGLAEGTIWALARSSDDTIWIGSEQGGLSAYSNGRFRTYTVDDGLPATYVYGLLLDSRERLWIGTRGGGLRLCDARPGGVLENCENYGTEAGLPSLEVKAFTEAKDGRIWVGTREGGVARYDEAGKFETFDGLRGDVYDLIVRHSNELVVGWVDRGITICTLPDLSPCREITKDAGLGDNAVIGLYEDREHNLWVGLDNGVSRLSTESLVIYSEDDGLGHSRALEAYPEDNGTVWMGTLAGLSRLTPDNKLKSWGSDDLKIPNAEVWAVTRDRFGQLWVGTTAGLCQFDEARGCFRVWDENDGLAGDDIYAVFESSQGDLWVGMTGGLTRLTLDASGKIAGVRAFTGDDGLVGSSVYGITEDTLRRIWVGTARGLSVWDGARLRGFTTDDGLPSNDVWDLAADTDGRVWIATNGGGLAVVSLGEEPEAVLEVETFGRPNHVPLLLATLARDRDGRLWLGTSGEGVVVFDPKNPAAPMPRFNKGSGLPGNETINVRIASDGKVWFAVTGGVVRFDPSRVEATLPIPKSTIVSVTTSAARRFVSTFTPRAEGDELLRGEPIVLAHNENGLRFEFRGLSYRGGSGVELEYRLNGFDEAWIRGLEPMKEYTNLDPGDYRFEVRTIVPERNTPGDVVSVFVEIESAFWQTRTFIALVLVALVGTLTAGYKARTESIRSRNRELELIVADRTDDLQRYTRALEEHSRQLNEANMRIRAAEEVKSDFLAKMSHELRTPLNVILGFSTILIDKSYDDRQMRFLNNIRDSGEHLLQLVNNLLDLSKVEAGRMDVVFETVDLVELVESVRELMEGYSGRHAVKIETSVANVTEAVVDVSKLRQIFFNLISNAVKFSARGGIVSVTVERLDAEDSPLEMDSYRIEVADRGPGMRKEDLSAVFEEFRQLPSTTGSGAGTGLGLAIVRHFTVLLSGRIDVRSEPGEGTIFEVVLPLDASFEHEAAKENREERRKEVRRATILVVEGDRQRFSKQAEILEAKGHVVVRSPDGADAARVARDIRPAVIVVDLILTDLDSLDTLRPLARDYPSAQTPTVFAAMSEDGTERLVAGVDLLLIEPLEAGDLVASLQLLGLTDPEKATQPVLLVTDNEQKTDIIRDSFERAQRGVRLLTTLDDAKSAVSKGLGAVLLVDVMARGVKAFDLVRQLQNDETTSQTPVMLLLPSDPRDAAARLTPGSESAPDPEELSNTVDLLVTRYRARTEKWNGR